MVGTGYNGVWLRVVALVCAGCSSTVVTESTRSEQPDVLPSDLGEMSIDMAIRSDGLDGQGIDGTVDPTDGAMQANSGLRDQGIDESITEAPLDAALMQAQDSGSIDAAQQPEPRPDFDGQSGALVTRDCLYRTYPYAVDILLSCGDERFGEVLRLHTFKRHAHGHRRVYNDQLITYRDQKLWFDGYDVSRCVIVDNRGRLGLSSSPDGCSVIDLVPNPNGFLIRQSSTGRCAGLGGARCGDHQFTGGRECGGIQHRYLPLVMDSCDSAMLFTFEESADACDGFFPQAACF